MKKYILITLFLEAIFIVDYRIYDIEVLPETIMWCWYNIMMMMIVVELVTAFFVFWEFRNLKGVSLFYKNSLIINIALIVVFIMCLRFLK